MRILLVEDEEILGSVLTTAMARALITVDWVKNGQQALAAVHSHNYDAILLDLGLPDVPGERVLSRMRSENITAPVIVVTARGQIEDRISILDLGADDYMVKPFNVQELQARLRAVRRRASTAVNVSDVQRVGPLELFQASRTARWNGRQVELTAKEFDVLEALVISRPRLVGRSQLEEALYGWGDEVESNSIEVYVHYLRRKISRNLIVTVRGKGYQLGSEELLNAEVRASRSTSNA